MPPRQTKADLQKQIAELEQQVAAARRPPDVLTITLSFDAAGRLLAGAVSYSNGVRELSAAKAVLRNVLQQTDQMLLAAVEREALAKARAGGESEREDDPTEQEEKAEQV